MNLIESVKSYINYEYDFPKKSSIAKSYDPDRPVIFVHIPKTSGFSIKNGLSHALQPRQVVDGFDRNHFGAFDGFDSIRTDIQAVIYDQANAMPKSADLITGHIAYSTSADSFPDGQFVTVLREPMTRLLSLWSFWRTFTDEELLPWGGWADRLRHSIGTLEAFAHCQSMAAAVDNVIVRTLLWPHPAIPIDGFINPRHDDFLVALAAQKLKRFDFVDHVENSDLPDNLSEWLGRPFAYRKLNVTKPVSAGLATSLYDELTPSCTAGLDSRARLDYRLWRMIVENRMPGVDPVALQRATFARTVARHAVLANG